VLTGIDEDGKASVPAAFELPAPFEYTAEWELPALFEVSGSFGFDGSAGCASEEEEGEGGLFVGATVCASDDALEAIGDP
jgi:hypothetical protein